MIRDPNAPKFEALIIPNEALESGGIEVLRAAIVEGQLHVTLRPTFPQPDRWGGLLSEVARRIARAYAADGRLDEGEVMVRICSSFVSVGPVATAGRPRRTAKKSAKRKASKKRGRK